MLTIILESVVIIFVDVWVCGEIDRVNNELCGIVGSGRLISFIGGLAEFSGGFQFERTGFLTRDKRWVE
jgi:hypothetical protein